MDNNFQPVVKKDEALFYKKCDKSYDYLPGNKVRLYVFFTNIVII